MTKKLKTKQIQKTYKKIKNPKNKATRQQISKIKIEK